MENNVSDLYLFLHSLSISSERMFLIEQKEELLETIVLLTPFYTYIFKLFFLIVNREMLETKNKTYFFF